MNILFINHSSPMKEGGVETRTREIAFRLARSGHRVTILCGKTSVDDPEVAEINGVRIFTRQTLPDFLLRRYPYPHYFSLAAANLLLMFHVRRFVRERKFDLIREDIAPFPPTFLLSLVRLPVPHRTAITHMMAGTLKGWVKYYGAVFGAAGYVMDRLLRSGRLKYDSIVCAARWMARELKEHPAISDRVSCSPNGVNLEEFNLPRPPERVYDARGNEQIRLLSVGRLAETKGHRYLIEALSKLKDSYPNVRLTIVGNGLLKPRLLQLATDLGVNDLVEIREPVSHKMMPELYAESDYFVMPSIWEGLPVSLIEAMASRLPVVVSDIEAITDVLDHRSAVFAVKENAEDLSDKLRWAFEHPEEVSRRAESAYEIAQTYDWAVAADLEIKAASHAAAGAQQGGLVEDRRVI